VPPKRCIRIDTINRIMKIKNNILAMSMDRIVIPLNPNNPAMIAIIKNSKAISSINILHVYS